MIGSVTILLAAAMAVNAQNQFLNATSFGPGSILLNENNAYSWGPLSLPARATLTNMRLTNSSGWTTGAPAFDIWLLSATAFATYSSGASTEVKPIEGWLTTRATTNATNWTNLYIPSSATTDSHVFISIDNRPYGGRAPPPGASVTVSWDDIQWVTGDAVTKFNGPCGTLTINTGPGQAMFAELGNGTPQVKATGVATASAEFAAYIFDQTNRDLYLASGNFSLNSTNGVICQNATVCTVANNGTWFFVLGSNGSGSVKYDFAIGAGINGSCATTTTTITPTNSTIVTTTSDGGNSTTTMVISNSTTTTANINSTTTTTANINSTTTADFNSTTTTTGVDLTNSTSSTGTGSEEDTTSDVDSASTLLLHAALLASFLIALF